MFGVRSLILPHGGVRKVSFPPNLESNVTKFAPHKALELSLRGKLTFDDRVVFHRVEGLRGREHVVTISVSTLSDPAFQLRFQRVSGNEITT